MATILVKLIHDGEFVKLRTVSREKKNSHISGSIYIDAEKFDNLLEYGESFMDMDGNSTVSMRKWGGYIRLHVVWVDGNRAYTEFLKIPEDAIEDNTEKKFSYLCDDEQYERIVLNGRAMQTVKNICENKYVKRAFCKAIRNWKYRGNGEIQLFSDGEYDFGFYDTSDGIHGGLILSTYRDRHGYMRTQYNIHT